MAETVTAPTSHQGERPRTPKGRRRPGPAPIDLADLRRLADAATGGPWEAEWDGHELSVRGPDAQTRKNDDGTLTRPTCYMDTDIIYEVVIDGDEVDPGADGRQREVDAAFIAASRGVVPVFVSVVDEILALHKLVFPVFPSVAWEASGKYPTCEECHSAYPCATVRILAPHLTAGHLLVEHAMTPDTPAIDIAYLERQRDFQLRTFGPRQTTTGVLDHVRRELAEIEQHPDDISEWADALILLLGGAMRRGFTPAQVIDAVHTNQTRNEGRTWPDWRTADPDRAIEHARTHDDLAETDTTAAQFDTVWADAALAPDSENAVGFGQAETPGPNALDHLDYPDRPSRLRPHGSTGPAGDARG